MKFFLIILLVILTYESFANAKPRIRGFNHYGPPSVSRAIGKITYEKDKAFIDVFESWTSSVKRIQISQGKYDVNLLDESFPYPFELPPKDSIVFFSSTVLEDSINKSFSIIKTDNFKTMMAHSTFHWEVISKDEQIQIHKKIGRPKFYPNGKKYTIPSLKETYDFDIYPIGLTNFETREDFIKLLKKARSISKGFIFESNKNFILKVEHSWISPDREIFLSHGTFNDLKEVPLRYRYPDWKELKSNFKNFLIISFLPPNKINRPLEREFNPQDKYPEYDFASLKYSNTIILEATDENIKLIEKTLGKPKYNFK